MKKIIAIVMALSILMVVTACGGASLGDSVDESSNDTIISSSSYDSSASAQTIQKIADLLPDPSDFFNQGELTVVVEDDGDNYYIRVTNYKDGEYKAYINACKAGNFSSVHFEGEEMFLAYSADQAYYLQVNLVSSVQSIDIICNTVTTD